MSIRSNTRPIGWDLSPELQDVLRRNGMQAHVIREGESYKLFVQGHDSPMISYDLDINQLKKLTDWGTNFANKSAYNTFVDLVEKDFYLPRNFVHARNANGRVAMGLHGYRIGVGEYGRMPIDGRSPLRHFFGPSFLGWTPRQQAGFHMRRIGPAMFMQNGAPIVPERPDHRMKPGELQNGGYGFYYKGRQEQQIQQAPPKEDVLKELSAVIKPVPPEIRHEGAALPYKEAITSPVYFSNEKLQQSLVTHGIIINEEKKTLTVQSSKSDVDFIYDLSDSELQKLTSNSLKEVSMDQRLGLLNEIISNDFSDAITMDMLNSKQALALEVRPSVTQDLQRSQQLMQDNAITNAEQAQQQEVPQMGMQSNLETVSRTPFEQRLNAHGIVIDAAASTMTVTTAEAKQGITYSLSPEALQTLKNDSLQTVPVETRLDLLNTIIGREFREPITMDMLNRPEPLSIKLRPAVAQDLEYRSQLQAGLSKPTEVKTEQKAAAIPYEDLISSRRKFDGEKFEECLKSHGIEIDKESRRLIVNSTEADRTYVYHVSAGEIRDLLNDSLKEIPMEKRLDFLNSKISYDFHDFISMETLNSKEALSIRPRSAVEHAQANSVQLTEGQQNQESSKQEVKNDAVPYKYLVSSPELFNHERFELCLKTHGVDIDAESSTMTIKSSDNQHAFTYELRPDELEKLQSDTVKLPSVNDRLNLINLIASKDFREPITMEVLNSKEPLSIRVRPSVEKRLEYEAQLSAGQSVKPPKGMSHQEAKPYDELIKSPEKFNGERFEKCLNSHGIEIDKESNRLIVNSTEANRKYDYHLSPQDMDKLLSNSLEQSPLDRRLDLVNLIIARDFYTPVTMEALNSEQPLSIRLRSDVERERGWRAEENVADAGVKVTPVLETPEPIPYKVLIPSPEQFNRENFELCLKSHGIQIDAANNEVLVQSNKENQAFSYHLRPEEMKQLLSNDLTESPMENRLDLLNQVIGKEFYPQISMDSLNSQQILDMRMRPVIQEEERFLAQETATETVAFHMNGNVLSELNSKKAWYREDGEKEQVQVDDIRVAKDSEGQYKMTAVINGESITHEISQKQFEKFSAIDEYHRLKLFDKVFDEVDMKTMPGKGFNLLAAVSAGLAVARDLVASPQYGPDIYAEVYNRPHVYFKPGVDTPQDLASRAFDAGVNAAETGVGLGHQR